MSLLLSKEQVIAAMSLDEEGLRKAMEEGGLPVGYFTAGAMSEVKFNGMTLSGQCVYSFMCNDGSSEDGEPFNVQVWVTYKRREMSKEVYLEAEY